MERDPCVVASARAEREDDPLLLEEAERIGDGHPLGLELLGHKRKAVSARRFVQLPIPAGEDEILAFGEGERSRQVNGVIGAQGMSASALGRLFEQGVAHRVGVKRPPETIKLSEAAA
jgi:hypothetical protein